MDIIILVKLTSRAWCLDILASLASDIPGRQAALLAATGATRTAFRQSLNHLFELGLVERSPGHGHPLRPEFRLTVRGKVVAGIASRILDVVLREEVGAVLRKTWTVPVLAVTSQPKRFSVIRSDLPGITDRALSKSLQLLQDQDWIARDVDPAGRPPRPTYMAINTGEVISLAANA